MSGRFEIRLGPLKEPWFDYCRSKGVDPTDGVKDVIRRLLEAEARAKGSVSKVFDVVEETEERKPVKIILSRSEREAVDARAEAEHYTAGTKWIVAMVRAHLTERPQFNERELDILGESNHQLLAIGRNLNQIAHKLNANPGETQVYDRELVEELAGAVRKHVAKVGDLIRGSVYRWKLK